MTLRDLEYAFPEAALATAPRRPSRVALSVGPSAPVEVTVEGLLDLFRADDLLVVNETKVVPARVFGEDDRDFLFLKPHDQTSWDVLFSSRAAAVGDTFRLPGGVGATLVSKGLPQRIRVDRALSADYFARFGELALPPYIQAARGERHARPDDADWYQTAWASHPGSIAAPTASLHLLPEHLARVANVAKITLHVGAGTFFPVRSENLEEHRMHAESVHLPAESVAKIRACRGRVWALGTTVARALESMDALSEGPNGDLFGETTLFIYPPYRFRVVDVLLTNFHQPRSTLLALVAAFAGLDRVRSTYDWAIANGFKLFSYGDLSAWMPPAGTP